MSDNASAFLSRRTARNLRRFGFAGLLAGGLVAGFHLFSGGAGHLAPSTDVATAAEAGPDGAQELSREMARVSGWLSRRYKVSAVAIEPALRAAEDAGRRFGVDPMLLVAMIAVESSFNPFAESQFGAQGLMQVIPRYHMDKIGAEAGKDALFDPELNVRVGAQVLHEGLRRYGSLQTALQYYGGALGDPGAAYASRVLTMKRRLAVAAGRRENAV
ncbi:MAG: lytic transglycosylase domain-containing protein [Azoarcus sp.]|jgi:soluble lytic murein transglycosylase-like protein|nr:lytic transglycosylase domain-containing protein [Azoarcus sp.]